MSEAIYTLTVEERKDTGKGASRRLRHAKKIPGIIYGGTKAQKPMSITLDGNEIKKATQHEGFFAHVLTLNIGSKSQQALLVDVQRHPSRGWVTHMDFQRVSKSTVVHKKIPVHFLNEEKCPGVKSGGIVQHNLTEIEVTCKASDLPEYLEVDMAGLNVGDVVHLSDISVPKGVTIIELTHGEDHDAPVCSILGAAKQVDEDAEEDAAAAAEAAAASAEEASESEGEDKE
ncbi:MAG: 50S ribosomal protein L25/general stress protein Ctc [Natronospirillum sp.]|uniref:50S ribosomal protein L25/general stress protein Ctc n=1 Tax=Natronospirillum sp. TaxID=2812955 RepID=UPI0025CC2D8C|nr:50S ribosomal protein L25/general stress protein Ctc [Natronospirillum sp.]MCH8553011.1 50S ribosomal protein L25/general stress protein Ctc [Natronospirillum sp.]